MPSPSGLPKPAQLEPPARPCGAYNRPALGQLTLSQDGRYASLTAYFVIYLNDYDDVEIFTPRLIVLDIHSAQAEVRLPHKPKP